MSDYSTEHGGFVYLRNVSLPLHSTQAITIGLVTTGRVRKSEGGGKGKRTSATESMSMKDTKPHNKGKAHLC